MIKIALTHGDSRYQNIYQALELLGDELKEKIKDKQKIVIKINFVRTDKGELTVTHPQAVRAVLDFVKKYNDLPVTLAEAPYYKDFEHGLKTFGYYEILKGCNVLYRDLQKDETVTYKITEPRLKSFLKGSYKVKIAKTIIDSDFRISITPPKTHDTSVVTLGLKNLAVGSTIVNKLGGHYYRYMYHFSYYQGNLLLKEVCKLTYPHLNILDGFQAMEGNGPAHGTSVDWKIAIAGTDALAVDCLATYLMGFKLADIGYFTYLKEENFGEADLNNIEVVGEQDWQRFKRQFKPHNKYYLQIKWTR